MTTRFRDFRFTLIRLLAGRMQVVLNCTVCGGLELDGERASLISRNTIYAQRQFPVRSYGLRSWLGKRLVAWGMRLAWKGEPPIRPSAIHIHDGQAGGLVSDCQIVG